jgi:hypothetical protein
LFEEEDKQKRLLWKLKDLKEKTKQWQKLRYNQQSNATLKGLEQDITSLLQESMEVELTREKESLLKTKEQERNRLINEK